MLDEVTKSAACAGQKVPNPDMAARVRPKKKAAPQATLNSSPMIVDQAASSVELRRRLRIINPPRSIAAAALVSLYGHIRIRRQPNFAGRSFPGFQTGKVQTRKEWPCASLQHPSLLLRLLRLSPSGRRPSCGHKEQPLNPRHR